MDIDTIQKILDESRDLSTLPQVMFEVLRLARDDDSTTGELATVLLKDPTLSADVLRLVNTPLFGRRERISSVREAVARLGMRNVMAVALSASVYDLTSNWHSALDRRRFWRHSLETAIAGRMLAEAVGHRPAEEIYVAGMLHDYGMLVLEKAFPAGFAHVWVEAGLGGDQSALERERWGADHAQIGQFLLERWQLPTSITNAVGWHHSFLVPASVSQENRPSLLVRLAHIISHFTLRVEPVKSATQVFLKEDLRKLLGISTIDLNRIEEELFERTLAEAQYLEIDVGTAEEIMKETHRLLFEQYITVDNLIQELEAQREQRATMWSASYN